MKLTEINKSSTYVRFLNFDRVKNSTENPTGGDNDIKLFGLDLLFLALKR